MVLEEESHWSVLGVAPGATTADIKRAYARRLREIRPDEDAEGFQLLVEARDLALQFASGAARSERPSQSLGWTVSELVETDSPQPERQPILKSRSAGVVPSPVAVTSAERESEPQLLACLEHTLASDTLEGWQAVVIAAGQFSHARRAALEPQIIEWLSFHSAQEDPNLASWPPEKWAF